MIDAREHERGIAHVLRAGVVVSGTLLAIGAGWKFDWQADPFTPLRTYAPRPLPYELGALFEARDWPTLFCYVGLGVLVCLPLVRVLLTAFLFVRTGERLLAAIAAGVFTALVLGFTLGFDF